MDSDARRDEGLIAGWLAPTALTRARAVERVGQVDRASRITGALTTGVLVWCALARGWWPIVALAAVVIEVELGPLVLRRGVRAEYWTFAAGLFKFVACAVAAAMTGGPASPIAYLLLVSLTIEATRGIPRWVQISCTLTAAVFIAACLLKSPSIITDHLLETAALLVAMAGITMAASTLAGAEIAYRSSSVLDPLTGLLNRGALEDRFQELAEQARLMQAPICVILFDLDHFKAINDTHGHDVGDQILREVAYQARKSLRKFELLYRIGGEEFLLILPGLDDREGARVAEQLRETIEKIRLPGEIRVTASFGVSSGAGEAIDFQALYRQADQALYRSKSDGRNRVATSTQLSPELR